MGATTCTQVVQRDDVYKFGSRARSVAGDGHDLSTSRGTRLLEWNCDDAVPNPLCDPGWIDAHRTHICPYCTTIAPNAPIDSIEVDRLPDATIAFEAKLALMLLSPQFVELVGDELLSIGKTASVRAGGRDSGWLVILRENSLLIRGKADGVLANYSRLCKLCGRLIVNGYESPYVMAQSLAPGRTVWTSSQGSLIVRSDVWGPIFASNLLFAKTIHSKPIRVRAEPLDGLPVELNCWPDDTVKAAYLAAGGVESYSSQSPATRDMLRRHRIGVPGEDFDGHDLARAWKWRLRVDR